MKARNIKVTTTSGFDGVKIEEYLEPITAHVVTGMNIFKDIISGLTDITGGNSMTYENTLTEINKKVLIMLRHKAHLLGGNCILGLKIDNDEVSAQGKSMMMVTALGTVAKADFSKKHSENIEENRTKILGYESFNILNQKKQYIGNSSQTDHLIPI